MSARATVAGANGFQGTIERQSSSGSVKGVYMKESALLTLVSEKYREKLKPHTRRFERSDDHGNMDWWVEVQDCQEAGRCAACH